MTPEVVLTCFALAASWAPEPAMGTAAPPACALADLDIAGRFSYVTPDPGIAARFELPRSRAELGVTGGPGLSARFAVEAVRIAPEAGTSGVEESYVARVQIVEARFTHAPWGIWLAAGLVDELWIPRGERVWGWRPVAPVVTQAYGLLDRSDLGGTLGWTAPDRIASVTVTLTTGEGAIQRERNEGKNLTGMLVVRPLAILDPAWADRLLVELMARDGSRGIESARDHRFAARVSGGLPQLYGGFEWVYALGVGGNPDSTPNVISTWVRSDPWGPLTAFARFDWAQWIPGDPDSRSNGLVIGAGTRLPFRAGAPGHLVVGWGRRRAGDQAAPVAGAAGPVNDDTIFIQLGIRLRGAIALAPPPP